MKDQVDDSSSQFLKTGGGKTKPISIEIPSISLPKGGGAIKGIDEKFSVNAVNGTASFSIPLPFSNARGASPSLSLSYNSGAGNDIFGLGWSLGLGTIKRKTEKGLPQYSDSNESDVFQFAGVEDLVPEFKKENDGSFPKDETGEYIFNEKDSPDNLFKIRFYKPRIEGLFARIERWTEKTTGIIKWRILTKENHCTLIGWTNSSVISDPNNTVKIFEWLPEFSFDDKGNCNQYVYKKEDASGFDSLLINNKNRFRNGNITYTNMYLEKVLYGNKTPYKKSGDPFPLEADYMFQTVFDYGEYDVNAPFSKIKEWDFRTDSFSDYKAGFEIRTTRLCRRVMLFHYFNELPGASALIHSVNLEYDHSTDEGFTFLKSVRSFGYIKKADSTYTSKNLPATEFEYQKHEWNKEVKSISTENLVNAPSGLDDQYYQFTDLFNEGLSGILSEQANGWYYKHNLGDGTFERAKLVTPKPSFIGLGSQLQLTDLDADGGKQLASFGTEPKGYFELDDDNNWQRFKNFQNIPNIEFGDSNTRMLDLNGDGKPEVLISEDNVFTWYTSEGRKGFNRARKTPKPFDEEAGADMVFADEKQTIFLADMAGDGMTDIVRIRNGEVCYWPNLGYGNFGAKVAMDNPPVFDNPDFFNPAYLRLADIDGSGTTDIIYLGKNKFTCWLNLSGNSFGPTPFEIDVFPDIHNQAKITVIDLLGNGVACVVWSSALSKDASTPLKYIDLMNSKKPHLMVSYKNNLGKEVSLEYTASTKFYIEDKLGERPWITRLHFPVHCISKTETVDKISGWHFVSSYKYHHGYYDHPEREFRGFGMVEQKDTESFEDWAKVNATNIVEKDLHQEPVVSKTWFHTGAFLLRDKILNQFAHEYWYEEMTRQGFTVVNHEVPLPEARIIPAPGVSNTEVDQLSGEEWQEALRACKGMMLRSEVFAHDAPAIGATEDQIKTQLTPYSVATQNCLIELLQPKGKNRYAIFVVKESEAITYNYERNTGDPRIAHNLNIKLDEFGNVLESAAVVYPRVLTDSNLPLLTQQEQNETIIFYTQNKLTNDVLGDDVYRLRLPSEVRTFELKGVAKTGTYYAVGDFENMLTLSGEVPYQQIDINPAPGTSQKRLIEHVRTNYYDNNLNGPLALNILQSLAIPYESYQLAYTPALLTDIFTPVPVNDALMIEGKFSHSIDELDAEDTNWWIRSGTTQFIEGAETASDAQNRFYLPISYTDPFGSKTSVKYDVSYLLFIKETIDALLNKTSVDLFNFRTLSPQRMRDINNNLSEAIADELGLVKAMAIFGKGLEADDLTGLSESTEQAELDLVNQFFSTPDTLEGVTDSQALTSKANSLLQHATARFFYDFDVYNASGKPSVVVSIVREEHFQKNHNSPLQLRFEYSNGIGSVIMKKVQAEPGLAKKVIVNHDESYTISDIDTSALNPTQLRWIGNGRTILNNKGNAVKQYEPYFSVNNRYEDLKELVETGVTPIMFYDAMGRLVKTEMPDDTLSCVEFDSWKQTVYDPNDTILESAWYANRTNRLIDNELLADGKDPVLEKAAADKAARHANTPTVLHFDTLGRPVLSIAHNIDITTDADEFLRTKVNRDLEGNLLSVTDAREIAENSNLGNLVMQYKYDMLGNLVYQNSMDAGQRWLLMNILGNPLRTWDERNHEFQYFYDIAHRPINTSVTGGDGLTPLNNVFDRIIYGESLLLPDRSNEASLQTINVLGKPIKHFDTGGVILTPEYDFKGQPKFTTRKLFKKYKETANWTDANLAGDLENDEFTVTTETDALGRITQQTTPDGSIATPSYNEASLLNSELVTHINPALSTNYIKDIDYNEKGQRKKIIYGNDVFTNIYYDRKTFRLIRLETKRKNNDPLEDWHYTFDPAGNITHISDTNIPVVFFNNQKITGLSEYTYDAIYRLCEATGRENNAALNFDSHDNWNDAPFMQDMNPGDPMAVRNYTQSYAYDEVGNIKTMIHVATGNNWTRGYSYENTTNRILSTLVGAETYSYDHHPKHGFIQVMPHLVEMSWNFREELIKTIQQKVNPGNGIAETTYYQYDGQGQRIRKITENSAQEGAIPTLKNERIYIGGYETFRTYQANTPNFERETLSLIDSGDRFVMVETVKQNTDSAPPPTDKVGARLTRYQLHNHLGSAAIELDESAQVISYEEYHPYGTTSYQAKNATIKATAKRYRYTGMERDEETGLEYHSARYYMPWLGRWLSCDPKGLVDGSNLYCYTLNNPIRYIDSSGTDINHDECKRSGCHKSREDLPASHPFNRHPGISPLIANIPDENKARVEGAVSDIWNYPLAPISLPVRAVHFVSSNLVNMAVDVGLGPLKGDPVHESLVKPVRTWAPVVLDVAATSAIGAGFAEPVNGLTAERGTVSSAFKAREISNPALDTEATVIKTEVKTGIDVVEPKSTPKVSASPGVIVRKEGNFYIKTVDPNANRILRWYGKRSLKQQSEGLLKLGDLGTPHTFENGRLITLDAGEYNGNFWKTWREGSRRLGTYFNDIRPRNIGANGIIFDPSLDPIAQNLYRITATSLVGAAAYGAYKLFSDDKKQTDSKKIISPDNKH
jgi:RHS repeat-associated protein